jgi:hypothetical protein
MWETITSVFFNASFCFVIIKAGTIVPDILSYCIGTRISIPYLWGDLVS